MKSPEELLCSRKWRMANGLWMIWGWVPLGLTAWVGYLIIGIKSRNWKWLVTSAAFFTFGTILLVVLGTLPVVEKGEALPEPYGTYSAVAGLVSTGIWLGNALGLQWWVNRRWLVWRANNTGHARPWYATATSNREQVDDQPRAAEAVDRALAGLGSNAASSSSEQPAARSAPDVASTSADAVNINSAGLRELMGLPGMDMETAERVITARAQGGPFGDAVELITRANMKPHVYSALQSHVTAKAEPKVPSDSELRSRTSSDSGRRLEF